MSEIQPYHKKKNLFKFFKSKEFNEARVLMCAIYILLSYVNELIEKVDRLLQGFDGMMIGMLKHKAKQATKAFDEYFKEYELHIEGGCDQLCDTTIIATSALDTAIKQSEFFLGESTKAIRKAIDEQMKETLQTEYEKGRFDMMEEMMKALIGGEIVKDIHNQLSVKSEPLNDAFRDSKFGEKVRIIIVKEEQQ